MKNKKKKRIFLFLLFLRNFRLFVALLLTDTSLPKNSILVFKIKQEALGAGLFEVT
jgi:hypothetical protein